MTEQLQEYVDSRGLTLRVDREAGILRGVKLIGLESRNGRRYRESALLQAVALYEQAKVNVNHPKGGPLAPRDYQDRIGVIRDVEMRADDGLFGNLHFNPKHTLSEQLVWDAEHNPRNVGFSHNVLARVSRDGEVAVVEEITRVQSVDLVADPAATHGLFEQAESETTRTLDTKLSWSEITCEMLRRHRPDLLEAFQSTPVESLRQELSDAQEMIQTLRRRQRVVELLGEHRLSIPSETSGTDASKSSARETVSPLFFETLMNMEDESQIEGLIVERANLARCSVYGRSNRSSPCSRDQMSVLTTNHVRKETAAEFAHSLKIA